MRKTRELAPGCMGLLAISFCLLAVSLPVVEGAKFAAEGVRIADIEVSASELAVVLSQPYRKGDMEKRVGIYGLPEMKRGRDAPDLPFWCGVCFRNFLGETIERKWGCYLQ